VAAELRLRLLGGVEVSLDGEPVGEALSSKPLALLIYLAVTGRPHSRAALAGLLWGERPEVQALTNLRQALAQLRRVVPAHLRVTRRAVAFERGAPYWLDVEAFEGKVREAEDISRGGEMGVTALEEALALYRGDLLEGFYVREAPAFEEWVALQREYLRTRALEALHVLAAYYTDRGNYVHALHYVDRLIALDSWQEEAHRHRMLLLARLGRHSEALAQYEACRQILWQEFGVEPSAETQRLYERILAARRVRRHPLPPQPTPFVGREEELEHLARLLADPACRLLTLTGPGGIGKTRLALQAAERSGGQFLHGVHFVPLTALPSALFLPSAILRVLEVSPRGGVDPKASLLGYLRDKEMLLVLDGFEHLLEGAPLLAEILESSPDVKLLVTSRERLNLRWEWVVPVGGLQVPPDGRAADPEAYSAVRLFLQSARRVHPHFSLEEGVGSVTRICRLVEGSPLGIELAAAWVQTLPAGEVVRRMEQSLDFLRATAQDVPPRHRSLRAVFDSSWRLLSPEEQQVFRRLSVFRGGFDSGAARWVARASAYLLSALEAKSLLRREGTERYVMHETLREYAAEMLRRAPDEETAVRDRHCAFYADLLRQAEARSKQGGAIDETVREVEREIENVRAGWAWAVERGRAEDIGKMVGMFARLYEAQGLFKEGLRALDEAVNRLEEVGGGKAERIIGRLRAREGLFAYYLGQHERARELAREGLRVAKRHGDRWEAAFALNVLGILAGIRGDYDEERRLFGEALACYRAVGDKGQMAILLNNLGIAERLVGAYDEAERFSRESLEIARALGVRRTEARALQNLALIAYCRGEYREAKRLHEESLRILRKEGDPWGIALALGNMGEAARLLGEYAEARRCYEESLALRRQIGDRWGTAITLSSLGSLACAEGEHRTARRYFGQALRLALEIPALPLALDVLVEFSELLVAQGREESALEVLALCLDHPATEAWVREKAEKRFQEIASRLPPAVVTEARKRGQEREIEAVVTELL